MLKQLKIRNKLKALTLELEALRSKKGEFEIRKAELELACEEAQTEEDIALVEEQIIKLEEEFATEKLGEDEASVEDEIKKLEKELEDLDDKGTGKGSAEIPNVGQEERKNGGIAMSVRGTVFGNMTMEQRDGFVKRGEVKEFLERVRELKGQKRSVQGAELAIPDVVLDLIRDNLHRYSKLIMKVRLKPVPGKARQHILGTIPEGIWMEAVGTLNELEFAINQVEVDGYKVGGFVPVPNSTLEDSDLSLAAEIIDVLGQSIGLAVDKAILYGTGKKMPVGIATRLAQTAQPSNWDEKAPKWEDLHTSNISKFAGTGMTGAKFYEQIILSSGRAKANYSDGAKFWAMNSKTKTEFLAKALAFNAAGALVAGVDSTMPVIGGDIIELEFIPDNDVFFGYGMLYLLAERAGGTFATSDQVRFIEDQTVFKGTARYDGMPVIGKGFILLNINNMAPTTVMEFSPDKANETAGEVAEATE